LNRPFGFHQSISGGIYKALETAISSNLTAVQFFSRNPRGWKGSTITAEDIDKFKNTLQNSDIETTVIHTNYLINLATPDDELVLKSKKVLLEEMETARDLTVDYVVTHLGSHKGMGIEYGLKRVKESILWVHKHLDNGDNATLLLENSAGSGNLVGSNMDEISWLIKETDMNKIGICIDSAHAYASGYDIKTDEGMDEMLTQLDISFENIKLLHLNDSRYKLGTNKDKHEHLGKGYIGKKGLENFINDERLIKLPVIMETPINDEWDDDFNKKIFLEIIS
jgi:deoxyribonuclease-4